MSIFRELAQAIDQQGDCCRSERRQEPLMQLLTVVVITFLAVECSTSGELPNWSSRVARSNQSISR